MAWGTDSCLNSCVFRFFWFVLQTFYSARTISARARQIMRTMPRVVLIVEDAEFCAATLEILFGSIWNVKIMTASSAEQAWELLRNPPEPIGAMVTDLHMPGMDGFELIDRVRSDAQHATLPIMVITGSIEP